ncbi:putative inactive nicotinamidase [Nymphaea thermarum]|nr:putative inactive nicotinamidase [Nymphaea thermarum]
MRSGGPLTSPSRASEPLGVDKVDRLLRGPLSEPRVCLVDRVVERAQFRRLDSLQVGDGREQVEENGLVGRRHAGNLSLSLKRQQKIFKFFSFAFQNDFILPGGPMQVVGGAVVVPSVRKAVEIGRKRGALIIWVVREHDPFGRDVEIFRRHLYGDGKEKPVSKGSKGAELVDGLTIEERDYKLVKTRFSAFFATHLDGLLKSAGVTDLVVVGVQTPNCIRQTVFDAVALDYKSVTVIVDATAAATPDIHNGMHFTNIFDMKNIGVATPTLLEWCGDDA